MPGWERALEVALANLRPGGTVWIVDFGDLRSWPAWLRRVVVWWVGRFGVRPSNGPLERLVELEHAGGGRVKVVRFIGERYAYLVGLTKA